MMNKNKIVAMVLTLLLLTSCGAETMNNTSSKKEWTEVNNSEEKVMKKEAPEFKDNMTEITEDEFALMEELRVIIDKENAGEELTDEERTLLEEMDDKDPIGQWPKGNR